MKMYLGNTKINSMKVGTNTDDATLVASDLQAGVTAYAKGRKVTGTGKCFEFAQYGAVQTDIPLIVPSLINVVEITSTEYPIMSAIELKDIHDVDFSIAQQIGTVSMNSTTYPITITIVDGFMTFTCEQSLTLQVFYGKDGHI